MKDGFLKAAAFSPALRVADCTYNAQQILERLQAAAQRGVKLAVFPEFCLTGYTCGDLFLQRTLQQGALDALEWLLAQTRTLDTVALVGLPLLVHGKLYNCAAVLCRGQLLGIVPKTYLPNYGEFYEKRQFTPGSTEVQTVTVCGQQVLFGTSLLFRCRQMPSFVLGVELCEDLWSALPPSTFHALAGATVIANLSASDETVGKAEYRRALVANQSARLLCGYLYASAGHGESTTDMVFAGHDLIAEDGSILAETAPFAGDHAETELDCQRMEAERARNTSFEPRAEGYVTVEFDLAPEETVLTHHKAAGAVGKIHQLQRTHTRLPVFKGDVQHLFVLPDIHKVAAHGVGNADLLKAHAQLPAQNFGVAAGALGGAKAGQSTRTPCCTSGCATSTGAFLPSSSNAAACRMAPRWAA